MDYIFSAFVGKKIKSELPLELDLRNLNRKYKKQEQKKV